jgi:hypothetical protein
VRSGSSSRRKSSGGEADSFGAAWRGHGRWCWPRWASTRLSGGLHLRPDRLRRLAPLPLTRFLPSTRWAPIRRDCPIHSVRICPGRELQVRQMHLPMNWWSTCPFHRLMHFNHSNILDGRSHVYQLRLCFLQALGTLLIFFCIDFLLANAKNGHFLLCFFLRRLSRNDSFRSKGIRRTYPANKLCAAINFQRWQPLCMANFVSRLSILMWGSEGIGCSS